MTTHPGMAVLQDMTASGGDPADLTHQQIPLLRSLFESEDGWGMWLFARHVAGCNEITTHLHLEMCMFLSQWGYIELADGTRAKRHPREGDQVTDTWRRLMMAVPRDTFKTTLGTRVAALWQVTKDPELTIGIFNESEAKSRSWIGAIKNIIEQSRLYHVLWPERLPPGVHYKDTRSVPRSWKWGDSGLEFPRQSYAVAELTLEPFGIGGASTGKHFTHKILDDIIGEKSAESEAVMQDAIHWVDHARAIERPSDNGCELVNFTRWAYHDVYRHMLDKWPNDYKVYHRALLENPATREPDVVNGVSIFPERFPTAQCKQMYATDPFTFNSQRQCIPQAGRETAFDRSWVRYFDTESAGGGDIDLVIWRKHYDPKLTHADLTENAPNRVALHLCDKAVLVDPAPTRKAERTAEPRARNGLVAVAIDPWGRYFCLEATPLREDPVTVLNTLVEMCQRWVIDKVGIEEVNFSAVYIPLWTQILRAQHPGLQLSFAPLKPQNQDKDARIRALAGPHREGRWYYNSVGTDYATTELLEYPHSATRDLIDAMGYVDRMVSRLPTPAEAMGRRSRASRQTSDREPFTWY